MKRKLVIHSVVVSFLVVTVCHDLYGQFRNSNPDAFPVPSGVLTRPLERAKQAMAIEDYATAIDELEPLLGLTETGPFQIEDYLIFTDTNSAKRRSTANSIRQEAFRLVAQMPARGRNLLELKHGVAAKKKLLDAMNSGSLDKLNEVSRKYFHTKSGYTATFLLGQMQLSRGHFALSSRIFRRLFEVDAARSLMDPELSIQACIALAADNQLDEAVNLVQALKQKHPILQFELGGEIHSHTIGDEDATTNFVLQLVSQFQRKRSKSEFIFEKEWLTYRTNSQQPESIDEFPLPIPEWSVPQDGRNKKVLLDRLEKNQLERNLPALPALHSVALKGCVVMRTTNGVQAVDAVSGKRIWRYPWKEATAITSGFAFENELSASLWTGHSSGSISSDGQKVYFVKSNRPPNVRMSPNRTLGSNPIFPGTNSLIALKVVDEKGASVEGQLAWKIDSATSTDGDLKNCVFLGPPLVRNDYAYVIVERGGQIRLAALDANNGKTVWTQQLASTQSRDGWDDRIFRHRMSVSPVFVRGLLICPTLVGGLVAVDLSTHHLKWGFQYASISDSRALNDATSHRYPWYDDSLFVVDDKLCFSPVDSRSYYVLDIETGFLKNAEPKGKDFYVAGQFEGRLVVVGPDSITLDSATGISTTKISLADFGTPVGLGFFAGQNFYLPISGKKLLKIDLKAKKVTAARSTATQMGNLSFYQGRILSQSIRGLDSYWIGSSGKTVADELLEKTQDDALGLLLQAQIQNDQGETDRAISSIIRSIEQVHNNYSVAFLAQLLVTKINNGGKLDWERLDKGFALLTDPVQQRTYLLAKIESQFKSGDNTQAINEILKLVDLYSSTVGPITDFVAVTPELSLDGIRLIRTRLKKSVNALPVEQRMQFVVELKNRLAHSLKSDSVEKLRTIADIFGEMEFVGEASVQIIKRLLEQKSEKHYLWAHALLLKNWLKSPNSKRVQTLNALIELYLAKGDDKVPITRNRLVTAYELLSSTIRQLKGPEDSRELQRLLNSVQKSLEELTPVESTWAADGQAKIESYETEDLELIMMENTGVNYESKLQHIHRIGTLPISICSDFNGKFVVRDPLGFTIYTDSSRSPGTRHSNSNYRHTRFQVLGDLLILSYGYDHVGLDLSRISSTTRKLTIDMRGGLIGDDFGMDDDAVLWRYDAYRFSDDLGFTKYARESNSLGLVHSELVDNVGNRIGKTANVSEHGLCLLQMDSLVCLNPWDGKVNWKRSKIKTGSDMMGDGNNVFVFDPDNQSVVVYKQLDGSEIGKLEVPKDMVNRIVQNGSNVVSLREVDQKIVLFGFRLNEDEIVQQWQREFSAGTKATILRNDNLAILSPQGTFEIVDWKTGRQVQKTILNLEGEFASIQTIETGSEILLFVNENSQNKIEAKRLEFGAHPTATIQIDGLVYLLDQKGVKWQGPAKMDGYDFVLNQPSRAPVLFFRKQDKTKKETEIVFLRRSDGSLIDFSSPIEVSAPTTSIRFLPKENSLMFNIGYNWLKLNLTDIPRPPSPPARTGKYSSKHSPSKKTGESPSPSNDDDFLKDISDDFRDEKKVIERWIEAEQGRTPSKLGK